MNERLPLIDSLPSHLGLAERYKLPGVQAVSKLVELHRNYPDAPETLKLFEAEQ